MLPYSLQLKSCMSKTSALLKVTLFYDAAIKTERRICKLFYGMPLLTYPLFCPNC